MLCPYFLEGRCIFGSRCALEHGAGTEGSLRGKRASLETNAQPSFHVHEASPLEFTMDTSEDDGLIYTSLQWKLTCCGMEDLTEGLDTSPEELRVLGYALLLADPNTGLSGYRTHVNDLEEKADVAYRNAKRGFGFFARAMVNIMDRFNFGPIARSMAVQVEKFGSDSALQVAFNPVTSGVLPFPSLSAETVREVVSGAHPFLSAPPLQWNRWGSTFPFSLTSIKEDLVDQFPNWKLTCYGASAWGATLLSGLDTSPEELRVVYHNLRRTDNDNAVVAYERYADALHKKADGAYSAAKLDLPLLLAQATELHTAWRAIHRPQPATDVGKQFLRPPNATDIEDDLTNSFPRWKLTCYGYPGHHSLLSGLDTSPEELRLRCYNLRRTNPNLGFAIYKQYEERLKKKAEDVYSKARRDVPLLTRRAKEVHTAMLWDEARLRCLQIPTVWPSATQLPLNPAVKAAQKQSAYVPTTGVTFP